MGDRTYVELFVLLEHTDKARKIASTYRDPDEETAEGIYTRFAFDEVSYGKLPFLDALVFEGIPYESNYAAGGDFTEGTDSCKFTENGEAIIKEISKEEYSISIHKLYELLPSPAALGKFISERYEYVIVLPWANQLEYSKRYLARKLIEGNVNGRT
mgnify:CR=1 FL=1